MITTTPITSEDVVTRLFSNLPAKFDGTDPTPETNADKNSVYHILNRIPSQFARDLVQAMFRKAMTPKRWFWAIKLAGESLNPNVVTDTIAVKTAKIKALFDNAVNPNLKNPSVHLRLLDGSTVVVKRAGERTRNKANVGTLVVTDDGEYPSNKFYGRIGHDGNLKPTRKCTPQVIDALQQFAANPAKVAAEYGKLTGNCCFCRRPLTDARSTDQGYGPVCAKNYSLPWG